MEIDDGLTESRHYLKKTNQEIVHFPVLFRQEKISPQANSDILNAPIVSFRIITKILSDISYNQFQKDSKKRNVEQLNLFEKDLLTVNNSYARFTFNISDITSDTKNYRLLRKGLDFLKNIDQGWKKVKNKDGKWIHSEGGFVVLPTVGNGKISFLISSYWMEKLSNIDDGYNKMLYDISFHFKNTKHYLIYLWTLELKETGTKINYKKWQPVYMYNYSSASELCRNVFKPIKTIADRSSFKSFNYRVEGDIIHFKMYITKTIQEPLKEKTLTKHQITQKLSYWKFRHKLSKKQYDVIKNVVYKDTSSFSILKKAYTLLVNECRIKKVSVLEFQGAEFLTSFQEKIEEVYKNSVWSGIAKKGYPSIVD